MKFSCVKENLERAVSVAERFIGKNITLPILANILFEAQENNILVITATNLEYAVQVTIPGKTEKKGMVTVPAKILSSLLQNTIEEKIDIEVNQQNLFVHTDTKDTRINGMNPDDFPLIPKIKKNHTFKIVSTNLKDSIERVIPAVSTSEFKPELTGVFFSLTQTTLKVVATDTFRLAERTLPFDKKISENVSFILPHRVSLELAKIIPENQEVTISLGENQIMFEMENLRVISRLIEGNFPDYNGVIPKQFEVSSFARRDSVVRAVRSSSIFASKIQEVTFFFKESNLEISSANSEVGEYKTKIPMPFTGGGISVSFNYRYLLDGLSSLDEDEIYLGVNGETAPSVFRNKSDSSFLYVLMPIRLS